MHYKTLVTVDIPSNALSEAEKSQIEFRLLILKAVQATAKDPSEINAKINELKEQIKVFSLDVELTVMDRLEPYCECTENPKYLEFEDNTERFKDIYENKTVDCIKHPNGSLVPVDHHSLWNKFCIHADGKVYQKNFGPLKHDKRSKRAKKMTAVMNYPYKKIYKTFDKFVASEYGLQYNEEHGGYGYMYNPNAFWDWYQIGGRWPAAFLVRKTCTEFSLGDRSWCNEDYEYSAPEGYRWVAAARKKDIDWEAMKKWRIDTAKKEYALFKQAFDEGKSPKDYYGKIVGNKLIGIDEILYIDGESEETYLKRRGYYSKFKYPGVFCGYLEYDEYHQEYFWAGRHQTRKKQNRELRHKRKLWYTELNAFIDSLLPDEVLVCVDCHI